MGLRPGGAEPTLALLVALFGDGEAKDLAKHYILLLYIYHLYRFILQILCVYIYIYTYICIHIYSLPMYINLFFRDPALALLGEGKAKDPAGYDIVCVCIHIYIYIHTHTCNVV